MYSTLEMSDWVMPLGNFGEGCPALSSPIYLNAKRKFSFVAEIAFAKPLDPPGRKTNSLNQRFERFNVEIAVGCANPQNVVPYKIRTIKLPVQYFIFTSLILRMLQIDAN